MDDGYLLRRCRPHGSDATQRLGPRHGRTPTALQPGRGRARGRAHEQSPARRRRHGRLHPRRRPARYGHGAIPTPGTVRSGWASATARTGWDHRRPGTERAGLPGKILHVDRNGKGLPGHPFCPTNTTSTHVCTKIHAKGFRNPFRFTLRPAASWSVGDVGWASREEIDIVTAGGNSAGPATRGRSAHPATRDHLAAAPRVREGGHVRRSRAAGSTTTCATGGAAVIGGPDLHGRRLPRRTTRATSSSATMSNGYIKRLELAADGSGSEVKDFATAAGPVVDLQIGAERRPRLCATSGGAVQARSASPARRNRTPVAQARGHTDVGPTPLTVSVQQRRHQRPRRRRGHIYDWDSVTAPPRSTAANPEPHLLRAAGNYTARLKVTDQRAALSDTDTVADRTRRPAAESDRSPPPPPTARTGGCQLGSSATDPEQGNVPAVGPWIGRSSSYTTIRCTRSRQAPRARRASFTALIDTTPVRTTR